MPKIDIDKLAVDTRTGYPDPYRQAVLEGELTLIEDAGETMLRPGDAAGWKAGVADGHCLVNRTDRDAVYLEIGSRAANDVVDYPDIDMRLERIARDARFLHKSGDPYPGSER